MSKASFESYSWRRMWKFVIPSLLGIMLFMMPVLYEGKPSIPVAILAKNFQDLLGNLMVPMACVVMSVTALLSLYFSGLRFQQSSGQDKLLDLLFKTSPFWLVVRVLGAIFAWMSYRKIGSELIWSEAIGGLILNELIPVLMAVFLFAGLLLPLLVEFGLLEFIGTLMTKIMRPIFRLPGRSAVDCLASWLGDGSVGILLTNKQYESGFYTQREAAVIATSFSIVSISFGLTVLNQLKLEAMFLPFFLTVALSGILAAVIVPRLPPLSRKKDHFIRGESRHDASDEDASLSHHSCTSLWSRALIRAVHKADETGGIMLVLRSGLRNALEMIFCVLPVVMAMGVVALVVAEHTPLFQYLGAPFVPLLTWLGVPEAVRVSETVMVGFADMFIPSIMVVSLNNDAARFFVACLSVVQLIYMSEVGALLLGSRLPLKFWELLVIFIQRTLVTMPVIALAMHMLF